MNIRFLNESGQDVIDLWYMPDGQPYARINPDQSIEKNGQKISIHARIRSFDDLGLLLTGYFTLFHNVLNFRTELFLYYPFFGRQDRVTKSQGDWEVPETFMLFLDIMLRDMDFLDKIFVLHPHSEVYVNELEKYAETEVIDHSDFVARAIGDYKPDCLVLPDQGSSRFRDYYSKLFQLPIIQCYKTRDVVTGKLSNPGIESGTVNDRRCLIVDDICDGGGTFIQLAEMLRGKGAAHIGLYTTHGIYSRGYRPLVGKIDALFTTNSYHSQFMRDVEDSTALEKLTTKMYDAFPEEE